LSPDITAVPFIEANAARYRITWKNTGRVSDDWKVKLYEQSETGRQLAIYARKKTIIRLESMVAGVADVDELDRCPASHALEAGFSRFKGGVGVCVSVESEDALHELLDRYFAEPPATTTLNELMSNFDSEVEAAHIRSRAERLARLAKAPKKPRKVSVQASAFVRNPDVVAEVLDRAVGRCERCKSPAPFRRVSTGEPYLEVHHRLPLAQNGDDTVENAIALCPNCHRKSHYG
jgi:hypothetical protein